MGALDNHLSPFALGGRMRYADDPPAAAPELTWKLRIRHGSD